MNLKLLIIFAWTTTAFFQLNTMQHVEAIFSLMPNRIEKSTQPHSECFWSKYEAGRGALQSITVYRFDNNEDFRGSIKLHGSHINCIIGLTVDEARCYFNILQTHHKIIQLALACERSVQKMMQQITPANVQFPHLRIMVGDTSAANHYQNFFNVP